MLCLHEYLLDGQRWLSCLGFLTRPFSWTWLWIKGLVCSCCSRPSWNCIELLEGCCRQCWQCEYYRLCQLIMQIIVCFGYGGFADVVIAAVAVSEHLLVMMIMQWSSITDDGSHMPCVIDQVHFHVHMDYAVSGFLDIDHWSTCRRLPGFHIPKAIHIRLASGFHQCSIRLPTSNTIVCSMHTATSKNVAALKAGWCLPSGWDRLGWCRWRNHWHAGRLEKQWTGNDCFKFIKGSVWHTQLFLHLKKYYKIWPKCMPSVSTQVWKDVFVTTFRQLICVVWITEAAVVLM